MKFAAHLLALFVLVPVFSCNDASDIKPTQGVRAVSETEDG